MEKLLQSGSDELAAAFKADCLEAVAASTTFSLVHPELGDRPAALVRATAATVVQVILPAQDPDCVEYVSSARPC